MTPEGARRHPRADRRTIRATEAAWPVLAGAVTAVGLIGAARQWGLIGLVLVYAGCALFATVMLYGTLAESGMSATRAVRIGLVSSLVLVVLFGLLVLFPVGGWLAAAAVAVSSPAVTGPLAGLRRRGSAGPSAPPAAAVHPDQARVDRIFGQIVSGLEQDQSSEPDGT